MIKKMLAMLVAISCAFGAWADVTGHISGTDFSPLRAGSFVTGLDDNGEDTGTTYWYNGDQSDFEGTVVSNSPSEVYLDFESNITNPLYRTINNCNGLSPSQFTATPIGTGLFIDTHVQFTPYLVNENHPAPTGSGEDKLIVWVRETEVDGDANLTNLIVTAGYLDTNGDATKSNYVVNLSQAQASALCSGQHRLTIKSYQNITTYSGVYVMGFVVYIDEAAVEYIGNAFADDCAFLVAGLSPTPAQYYAQNGGHNKLFPCLMNYGTTDTSIDNYSKLAAVGYAGMGKIDDVVFDNYSTDFPEFARDDRMFSVEMGEGVTEYMYNNVRYTASSNLTAAASATSVTISNVVYASGYEHKDDTWYNTSSILGTQVVSNRVGAVGDYGTFYFADGETFTLVGFQANYQVVVGGSTNAYQTLFGNATEVGAIAAALSAGGTLKLTKDTTIAEGLHQNIVIGIGDTLTIDLDGHTLRGTIGYSIVNEGGSLTINDSSAGQTGKVLGSLVVDPEDPTAPPANNFCAIEITEFAVSTLLTAGTYDLITLTGASSDQLLITGGSYICPPEDEEHPEAQPSAFYLADSVEPGKTVSWDYDSVSGFWYAIVGGSVATTWDITFSTNNVVVTEWNLTVDDGDPIGNHIPNFTGGSWDAPAPTAETVVTSDTNFNYTIAVQLSYFPQIPIEEQWADRDGTAAKPFVIRNADDFAGLKDDIADGYNTDKYFEVVVDNITLTEWEGVGSSSAPFSGTLIGGGKTVNVTFKAGKKDNGLFAYVSNATISNLTVNVTAGSVSGQTGGAAFVGIAAGSCTFTALKATGTLGTSAIPTTHNSAGICERITTGDSSWIINFNSCTNEMSICANYTKVGGILAFRDGGLSEVNFNNCVNSGNITNVKPQPAEGTGAGGIMGWTGGLTDQKHGITLFNGCVNTGVISAATATNGNFVGYAHFAPTSAGVNIGLASLKPSGNGADATSCISDLNWATVSGDIATFVTPVATVDSVVAYKVMQPASTPNFTLAAAAASLTIDTSLAAYTGTVSVDSTLSEDYNLRETAIANGTIYSLESKTPADPWAPTEQTDAAASNKVVSIFGEGSDVANHVTTLAQYEALVTYIKSVTSQSEVPTDLTADQKTWMWKSFILGANPLFDEEPAVQITSLTAGATAGLWDFTVKVTEGDDTDAYNVAADKVGALVKISSSLTSGTWVAPTAGNISAVKLLGGNLIQVEVNFGDGTSGFMKVSEE